MDEVKSFNDALAGAVSTDIKAEDGKIHVVRTQDVDRILQHNHEVSEQLTKPFYGNAAMRYAGSIPFAVAEQWAFETGTRIGTKEFAEVVKKKLLDSDYARLRVQGF